MIQGRDNAAESLGHVLELLRVRRQSGLLSVECMQEGRLEEGEIYFQAGRPTYARTGQLSGQEALDQLLSWRQVYFTFLTDQPRPTIPLTTKDNTAVAANISTPPPLNTGNYVPAPPLPSSPPVRFPRGNASRTGGDYGYAANNTDDTRITPGLEWIVPKKVGGDRDVLSLPLTRPQRSIYMLVDGRRTISDLSRCTRKSLQEIEWLLSELRERGLISI